MYAIEIEPTLARQIQELHPKRFKNVYLRIVSLQSNPRPTESIMLDLDTYLVRVGPYSITYTVDDFQKRVRVFSIQAE